MGAAHCGHEEVVAWLLSEGADPSLRDSGNETALDKARHYNQQGCVRLLEVQPCSLSVVSSD